MSVTLEKIVMQSLNIVKGKTDKTVSKSDIIYCLMEAMGKNKSYIIANNDEVIGKNQLIKFNFMIDALKKGTPLAYVLGNQFFYGYKYYVDHNVLIPRPETEIIISEIIKRGDKIYKPQESFNLIDAGSGSGYIGLTINSERNQWNVILSEKSTTAAKVLKKNYCSESRDNCQLVMSDWLSAFHDNTANIIVSNPPYIEIRSSEIDKSVKDFEPPDALFSKDQGLSDIKRIIYESKKVLRKNGLLFIENGFDQSEKVVQILKENYFEDIDIILDYKEIYGLEKPKL